MAIGESEARSETEIHGFATVGLGLCADCLVENFNHDPSDPHAFHGSTCDVVNGMALTIVKGRGVCFDHFLRHIGFTP